eukprot:899340-Prymnesium_polylepis.1
MYSTRHFIYRTLHPSTEGRMYFEYNCSGVWSGVWSGVPHKLRSKWSDGQSRTLRAESVIMESENLVPDVTFLNSLEGRPPESGISAPLYSLLRERFWNLESGICSLAH